MCACVYLCVGRATWKNGDTSRCFAEMTVYVGIVVSHIYYNDCVRIYFVWLYFLLFIFLAYEYLFDTVLKRDIRLRK